MLIPVLAALAALPGVWSLGATANCSAGQAWVFFADGHYAEIMLPAGPINAVGQWRDEGNAIAYSHEHLPFTALAQPRTLKRMTVETRSDDRMDLRGPTGVARIFHRCPEGVLKAPPGQVAH